MQPDPVAPHLHMLHGNLAARRHYNRLYHTLSIDFVSTDAIHRFCCHLPLTASRNMQSAGPSGIDGAAHEQALPLLTAGQTRQVRQWCGGGEGMEFEVLWRSSVHGDSAEE